MIDPTSRPAFAASLARNITRRELNQARGILAVLGVLGIGTGMVLLGDLQHKIGALEAGTAALDRGLIHQVKILTYAGIGVSVVYLVCAFLVSRAPVVATVSGLVLFIATILAQAVIEPAQLIGPIGFGVRLAVLIALISAVRFARIYQRQRAETGNVSDADEPVDRRQLGPALAAVGALVVAGVVGGVLYVRSRGQAPGGKVRDRHNRVVELSSLWRDRRALVLFYAGFDRESDQLAEVNAHLNEFDATVIAISFDSPSRMEALHDKLGLGFELYSDRVFQVIPAWGVPFVIANTTSSATFVVETGGVISHKQIGEHPPLAELIRLTHR